ELLIVARIDDNAAVPGYRHPCPFMLEAPERGALHRGGVRVVRVDLDQPAEAVRLVGFLVDIEAVVKATPGIGAARHAIAPVIARLRVARQIIRLLVLAGRFGRGDEVTVEVLLT